MSVTAAVVQVPAGGDLQAALDNAAPGDTLVLQAGATYIGDFMLPVKPGASYITVQSSALGSLPAGYRVTPADAPKMPKLRPKAGVVLTAGARSHHYRFIGIEFQSIPGKYNLGLVQVGTGKQAVADLPHHFEFDRVYVHGDPVKGGKRGIAVNGTNIVIKNSYISNNMSTWQDTQAIAGWSGTEDVQILNNYLEASGENIMFLGGSGDPNLRPNRIVVRGNHLHKPLRWKPGHPSYDGTSWMVKNLFEIKTADNVTVDGNVLENNWPGAQNGVAVLINAATSEPVSNIQFTNNIIRNTKHGFTLCACPAKVDTVVLRNNLIEKVPGRFLLVLDGVGNLNVQHNTVLTGDVAYVGERGVPNAPGFVFRNNIVQRVSSGFVGGGTAEGTDTLDGYFAGYSFIKNVIIAAVASKYPVANYFPATLLQVGFTDLARRNYALLPASPYKFSATDGSDIGIDVPKLSATVGSAVSGRPGTVQSGVLP